MKTKYLIAVAVTFALGGAFGFSAPRGCTVLDGQSGQTATPGTMHKQLAKRAGEYTTVTKFSMQPGGPTNDSTGAAKLTVIVDGRFLLEENAGMFVGQPTKGTRIWGYDNSTKQYESVWMYSGSTGIMKLTGSSSDGGKTVNFVATFNDDNGVKQTFDAATRQLDDDHFVVGLYARGLDGSRGPTFDTTYTRKK
jgi:uncharacterized protein DUF1579